MKLPDEFASKVGKGVVTVALAASACLVGVGGAFAEDFGDSNASSTQVSLVESSPTVTSDDDTDSSTSSTPAVFWSTPSRASIDDSLLKTYGVRAGSAGGDFLGITNTNFDFTGGSASSADQYTGYLDSNGAALSTYTGAGLAIWATSVNENPNPYYQNLYYNAVKGTSLTQATTWMSNPSTSSWGDSNGSTSYVDNDSTGATTIAGLEYSPDIIFGANKYTNWNLNSDGTGSRTNIAASGYKATYVNNDATNIFTQIYTMGQLATAAADIIADTVDEDGNETRSTRYDSTESAVDYEKATKGQMLYIASQINAYETDVENGTPASEASGVAKKTVAYLYAIDADGTAYFFVPTASGLLSGDDTGLSSTNSESTADDNYAANNSTINMGYMSMLPFITNTFSSGNEFFTPDDDEDDSNNISGIIMKVEDIWKTNPTCTLAKAGTDGDAALAGVDVIIYNSTTATDLTGTSGGKNSSGVNNDYDGDGDGVADPLSYDEVEAWASAHKFEGTIIAGDDFGTSTNQGYGTVEATKDGMAPLLYCQRNYTADKNARAAWAFAQVYPELYDGNADATYAYWVDKVYHINTDNVSSVVAFMTNQSDTVTYSAEVAQDVSDKADAGWTWWNETGQYATGWKDYAYYTGSSRASYYGGGADAEESASTIGIFAPSSLWTVSNE